MTDSPRCLLIHPEFRARSFWNYRATCELAGARYPSAPLGIITVAALLPDAWPVRLVDCNVETLTEAHLDWADLVWTGGMISQQRETLRLIRMLRDRGKTVIVGGPDPTTSPHLYRDAHHLVLGEAEITLPRFLADRADGAPGALYECGEQRAELEHSPTPRFDLLKFDRYLNVGVQFARGCPFACEFCDIIELFGRKPRTKTPQQVLAELSRLHELGHRGPVDFVDDNFIGNKRAVRALLPRLRTWMEEHRWPFEFSTEASINLSDDEELLGLMRDVGFAAVFMGIESPDEATLAATRKFQNTRRSLAESMRRIYGFGIYVNTGYIVGFDTERGGVADGILQLIEASAVPVNMVGLLFALPNTQLQRRLAVEGRLSESFDAAPEDAGDQCTAGLNFVTLRPRADILRDYRRVIAESYTPEAYFGRVRAAGLLLDCSTRKMRLPLRHRFRDLRAFARIVWKLGIRARYRRQFWRTLVELAFRNPRALRDMVGLMALFLHLDTFRDFLVAQIDGRIARAAASEGGDRPAGSDALRADRVVTG